MSYRTRGDHVNHYTTDAIPYFIGQTSAMVSEQVVTTL
jgi:hypothetical protein